MKKISILLLLTLGSSVFGQMAFREEAFKSLLAEAKKQNKLIFVDAYASWCGPCKLMAKNVFTKTEVGNYYNTNFINTKIDMEKGEGVNLAKKYGVKAYPTFLFINGDGEAVYRSTGYYEDKDFIGIGKEANDPAKQISVLKKKFEAGEKDPEFLKNYMKVFMFSDRPLAENAALRYFEGMKGKPLTQEDMQFLFELTPDSTSPLYSEIQSRRTELTKVIPDANFDKILKSYQQKTVMNKAFNKETKVLDEAAFLAESQKFMTAEEARESLEKTKISVAFSKKDYSTYQALATKFYGDGSAAKFSSSELNSLAWNFFEKTNDAKATAQALKWAEQSVKKDENYANTDTLANLYLKAGDKKNAKLWAAKSIELAKKEGQEYSDTQKVLDAASK